MSKQKFTSPASVVEAYRKNPDQFMDPGYDRVSCTTRGQSQPIFQQNEVGRMILVPVGEDVYLIPHPYVRMDEVSYNDTGYAFAFECRGYQEGLSYNSFQLLRPASLRSTGRNTYIMASKGVLQM